MLYSLNWGVGCCNKTCLMILCLFYNIFQMRLKLSIQAPVIGCSHNEEELLFIWCKWCTMIRYALDRWASTQSLKYQTLIKVHWDQTLIKKRIGKISENDSSSFWKDAEQEQNRQEFRNRYKWVSAWRWVTRNWFNYG